MFIFELSKGIAFDVNGFKDDEVGLEYFFIIITLNLLI